MLSCCYVYMTIIIVIIITAMLSLRGRFNSCGLFECVTVCLIHTTISSRLLLSLRIYVNKCNLHSVPQCRMLNLGADESELERDFLTSGHCCCCFFYTVCTCTCRNVTRSLSLYVYCRTLDNSYVRYPNAIRVFKNQEPMLKSCQCTICSFRVNTRVFCLKQWITQFFHRETFQSLVKIII